MQVYKAVLEGIQTVAVKKLIDTGPRQQQKFAQEIAILRSCRSENIVCFLGESHTASKRTAMLSLQGAVYGPGLPH